MPLDIHLSSSEKEAEIIEPEMSFPEDLHDAIFFQKKGFKGKYAQFNRLIDYYSDTFYLGKQIMELKEELIDISINSEYKPLVSFSKIFISLCEKAITQSKNIYCFCD
jgi:hypothetical protein